MGSPQTQVEDVWEKGLVCVHLSIHGPRTVESPWGVSVQSGGFRLSEQHGDMINESCGAGLSK